MHVPVKQLFSCKNAALIAHKFNQINPVKNFCTDFNFTVIVILKFQLILEDEKIDISCIQAQPNKNFRLHTFYNLNFQRDFILFLSIFHEYLV